MDYLKALKTMRHDRPKAVQAHLPCQTSCASAYEADYKYVAKLIYAYFCNQSEKPCKAGENMQATHKYSEVQIQTPTFRTARQMC